MIDTGKWVSMIERKKEVMKLLNLENGCLIVDEKDLEELKEMVIAYGLDRDDGK